MRVTSPQMGLAFHWKWIFFLIQRFFDLAFLFGEFQILQGEEVVRRWASKRESCSGSLWGGALWLVGAEAGKARVLFLSSSGGCLRAIILNF